MVVCQYFLQGRCSFGQNCRNEHIYNNNAGGRGGGRNAGNNQLNNIVWQISNEVTAIEEGRQWPLSCFAPIKEGPCLPGWEDISPEEVRWTLYEAQKNGTVNQALNQINQWYKNAEKARNTLKQPSAEVVNMLNDILKGKKTAQSQSTTQSSFTTSTPDPKPAFRFDTAVTNIFGKPVTPTQNAGTIFGGGTPSGSPFQSQNVFGAPPLQSNSSGSSIFSRPQQQPSPGLFSGSANAGQNIFGSPAGGGVSNAPNPMFSGPNVTGQDIFQRHSGGNIFQANASSAFGAPSAPFGDGSGPFGSPQGNPFQAQGSSAPQGMSSPFAISENSSFASTSAPVRDVDSSVYSKMEDLNENEIKSFTSTTFTFGNIPLKPPPQQYC